MRTIAENLTREMEIQGVSDYDLEALCEIKGCKVSQPTILRIKKGIHSDPKPATIKKLATGLGISEARLWDTEDYIDGIVIEKPRAKSHNLIEIPLLDSAHTFRLYAWSNFTSSINETSESKTMNIDLMKVGYKISDSAFTVLIDTQDFRDHFKQGSYLIIDKIEGDFSDRNILMITFNDTNHKTLVRYRKIAGKDFFEMLERGYPQFIEINDCTNYTVHGIAVYKTQSECLI